MFVFNKTQDVFTNISDMMQIYVGEAQKGLSASFAVVYHSKNKAVAPLAFFSEKEDAKKCLEDIILYFQGKTTKYYPTATDQFGEVLMIEDKVKESILHTPDSMKGKIAVVKN